MKLFKNELWQESRIILLWLGYFFVFVMLRVYVDHIPLAGWLALGGQVILDMVCTFYCFRLVKTAHHQLSITFFIFGLSFIFAALADGSYNFIVNIIGNTEPKGFFQAVYAVPFLSFLVLQSAGWIKLFIHFQSQLRRTGFWIICLLSFASLGVITFAQVHTFSSDNASNYFHTLDNVFELIGYIAALACLFMAKRKEIFLLSVGFLIILATDFILRFSEISSTLVPESVLEAIWVLGLWFMAAAFYQLHSQKTLNSSELTHSWNGIQPQLQVFIFLIAMSSVTLSFFVAYQSLGEYSERSKLLGHMPPLFVISSLICAIISRAFTRRLSRPLANLKDLMDKFAQVDGFSLASNEINSIEISEFSKLRECLIRAFENVQEKIKNEKIYNRLAQQVAHDIRSPLAALTAVTQGLSELSEDKRIMVRSAVQRINDIANDLAERGNQSQSGEIQGVESDKMSVEFLTSLIDLLVSEKRLQYRSRLGISIQLALSAKSYGLFAKIQLAQFKRVLSNLVNNAVEALGENGTITVDLKTNLNDDICISVADTGKGIASKNLAKIFERGVSVDKKDGQGLGLFHARESVESWGGKIEIVSRVQENHGATVTITLPRQNEPDWFVPELFVYEKMTVVILDDDASIHQIWQGRFEAMNIQTELHHFSNGEALRQWHLDTTNGRGNLAPTTIGPMLILCDHEILGSAESGLDVIAELKLQDHTVLVTSRFEEKNIRERCKNLGIRLLPKNLAGFVPIKLKEISQDLQYVLIDDSRMNRTTWEIMAKRNQKKIVTFERPKDFYDVAEKINKDVQLYVDLNLGHGQNGKDVTKEISAQGFQKVYLYTGESSVDASQMPWLAGVVGKGVPFVG